MWEGLREFWPISATGVLKSFPSTALLMANTERSAVGQMQVIKLCLYGQ
jgi:hypothetical protein